MGIKLQKPLGLCRNWLSTSLVPICTLLLVSLNSTSGASFAASIRPSELYFEASHKFDSTQYAEAEQLLFQVLADLRKRPKDERPDIMKALYSGESANLVNVHNFSIMTLEKLAECKYALGKYDEIAPLMPELRELIKSGYTGTYSGSSTLTDQAYIAAFETLSYLKSGDLAAADRNLNYSAGLQNSGESKPMFARYLWLNTKLMLLQKQKRTSEAKQIAAQVAKLKSSLAIK